MRPADGAEARPTPGSFWLCGNCQNIKDLPVPVPPAPRYDVYSEDPDDRPYVWDLPEGGCACE